MIQLPLGFTAKVNADNVHIQKDFLKICVEIYPPVGSKSHNYFFCDYLDREPTAEEWNDKNLMALVPRHKELSPCLCHFLTIDSDMTKKDIEDLVKEIFDEETLRNIDIIQGDRIQEDKIRINKIGRLMNVSAKLGRGKPVNLEENKKTQLFKALKEKIEKVEK